MIVTPVRCLEQKNLNQIRRITGKKKRNNCLGSHLCGSQGRFFHDSVERDWSTEVALFRQLRLLVATCVASIGALFWSMVLLFMLKIGFALVMAQALQGFVLDDNANMDTRLEVNNLYGSFSKALYTTFEITHSGSWPSRVRPVIEKVSPWYSIPFLAYITLAARLEHWMIFAWLF